MAPNRKIAVYGAYGHTGRFVVSELRQRGFTPILAGRDPDKLKALAALHPGAEVRPAQVTDPESLDRALAGAEAVIHCAGPFAETSAKVIEAALRARIPYLDVAAEVEAVAASFEHYGARARAANIAMLPSMAFYGGLADLLATAAMGDWAEADEIHVAYALDSWKPTIGTRATGLSNVIRRGAGQRPVFSGRRIEYRSDRAPTREWIFPAPFGAQTVVSDYTSSEYITISHHLKAAKVHTCISANALKDLSNPDLPPPAPSDASGRSAQTFLVEVTVRRNGEQRRAVARGRDIYAVSAPLVVEAMERVLAQPRRAVGLMAAGEIGDARDFLQALSPAHLTFEVESARQDRARP